MFWTKKLMIGREISENISIFSEEDILSKAV